MKLIFQPGHYFCFCLLYNGIRRNLIGEDDLEQQGERIVMVTGATSGVGKVTALELARMGLRTVLVGRSLEKTVRTAAEIQVQSGNPQVDYLVGDLSSQAEIRRLVQEFKQRYDRLNVLVNNAGAVFVRRSLSVDGIEKTFALNHLAPFLLTNLLLDSLKNGAPARVVNVSSIAHRWAHLRWEDLEMQRAYTGWQAYYNSKLANVYFTYELARRLQNSAITVNALHPGFVKTNVGVSNRGFIGGLVAVLQWVAAVPPEEGAETSIYLAASPEVQGVTGKYFIHKRAVRSSASSYDLAAAQKLWEISRAMTGLELER